MSKESRKMSKVIQISIIGKIYGNVNADEVIGSRITLKKMYSSAGEVLPFVSARAIKYAIRQALKERGYEIDPFVENPEAKDTLRLTDVGDPRKYVDDDLFGYMVTKGKGKVAVRRQAPIALSYFKALKDTPIKAEFAARFPRSVEKESAPVPFEVEVAEFIGKLNCIVYDYVGIFSEDKKQENAPKDLPEKLDDDERKRRIKDFLEILLTPTYVLPRRTNSLNIPEYIAAIIVLSENGPLPVFQYLDYDFDNKKVNIESLKTMMNREEIKESSAKIFFVDYMDKIKKEELPQGIEKISVKMVIDEATKFLTAQQPKQQKNEQQGNR